MRLECALCGTPLEGSTHAICPTCRGMAPAGVMVTPHGPVVPGGFGSAMSATALLAPESQPAAPVPPASVLPERTLIQAVPEPQEEPVPAEPGIRFWPHQFISSLSATFLVMCLITILTIFAPAGLQSRADPNLTPAHVKPVWYFLSLYEFLHVVPTILGILAPLVAVAGLVALPFLDRNPERTPRRRMLAVTVCVLLCIGILALSIIGYME